MLYPAFLKLDGLPVVIVGGGSTASAKLGGLLAAGARVTVVAPVIGDAIRRRSGIQGLGPRASDLGRAADDAPVGARPEVTVVVRPFEARDLDGARWVIAAATPEVNREVAAAADARGLFCNAVDDKAAATAYLGGVVRRGEVELAISTGGVAPALAGLLREALDALLPEDLEDWIVLAARVRADHKKRGVPMEDRRPLLLRALQDRYS